MADQSRIEDLRRRVQRDPASIAFAQLAEEYRRDGHYAEAAETCRAGLALHPGYLSARVTLGRALIELDLLDEAQEELEVVLKSAPENLAAIRGVGEIHRRRGDLQKALDQFNAALALARNDPDLEETVDDLTRKLALKRGPDPDDGLSLEQMQGVFAAHLPAPAPRNPEQAAPLPEAARPEPAPQPELAPQPEPPPFEHAKATEPTQVTADPSADVADVERAEAPAGEEHAAEPLDEQHPSEIAVAGEPDITDARKDPAVDGASREEEPAESFDIEPSAEIAVAAREREDEEEPPFAEEPPLEEEPPFEEEPRIEEEARESLEELPDELRAAASDTVRVEAEAAAIPVQTESPAIPVEEEYPADALGNEHPALVDIEHAATFAQDDQRADVPQAEPLEEPLSAERRADLLTLEHLEAFLDAIHAVRAERRA